MSRLKIKTPLLEPSDISGKIGGQQTHHPRITPAARFVNKDDKLVSALPVKKG